MRFCLNIDHFATVRNARGGNQPDPILAALMAEQAGADGIVVHLREDRRHITDRDVYLLKDTIKTKLDLEMATNDEIIQIACKVKPELATLVPEHRMELTTEGGLDVIAGLDKIKETNKRLHDAGIKVSLFIEPNNDQIDASLEAGADVIEIHTGVYAEAKSEAKIAEEIDKIEAAALYAHNNGLGVNAGHGLDYHNIKPFRSIHTIDEVSIGHAVVARALFVGIDKAVKDMIGLLK
ncbi:MAG: pyridoxine 5'-phosphate synthase [Ignavibacteriales bacterium]|nr:MAG: pyridoxine 5'-phosphate synthase [Ignavibacteriaceae bacterium]MBW7872637.1 pyridoxine 5'-phosphate synthase [Ignavibacteria bacterium]MCZ2141809.1 pyridoxine 5'-phosphate synthase [Ignavibacteriales bacterium]OQY75612.1 MAG: pyridoxine 5'-phosphate synthase [Ignavibacteriales bacterium UTCHB3]MBV6444978.1 Pyridoxine 5'-phosphate synthase [Ignavibacteriaceae bacterium]